MNVVRRLNGQRAEIHPHPLILDGVLARKRRGRDFFARPILYSIEEFHLRLIDEANQIETPVLVAGSGL